MARLWHVYGTASSPDLAVWDRIGEAAGLGRGDVDLSAGILRVAQAAQYVGTSARLVIGPPKSERGIRLGHMPQHATVRVKSVGVVYEDDSSSWG